MAENKQIHVAPEIRLGLRGRLFVSCIVFSIVMHILLFSFIYQKPVSCKMVQKHDVSYEEMNIRIVLNQVTVTPTETSKMEDEETVDVLMVKEAPTETLPVETVENEPLVEENGVEPDPAVQDEVPAVSVSTEERHQIENAYWSEVCQRIARGLRYPKRAHANRWNGYVVVHLVVDSNGVVTGTLIEEGHLRPQLVSVIKRAIRKVSPVSPPPPELGAPLEADLPIRFVL